MVAPTRGGTEALNSSQTGAGGLQPPPQPPQPNNPKGGDAGSSSNDSIYYVPQKFLPNSKLHVYLAHKCPEIISFKKVDYNLYLILTALKRVIAKDKLFDPNNPTVILCDDALDDALDVKALHVTEIRDQVCLQLTPGNVSVEKAPEQPPDPVKGNQNQAAGLVQTQQQAGNVVAQSQPPTRGLVTYQLPGMPHPVALNPQPAPVVMPPPVRPAWAPNTPSSVPPNSSSPAFDIEGKYWVKPEFLRVLRAVEGVNQRQLVFKYKEVTALLSKYITMRKNRFFDERNIKICFVENDLLGQAFNLKAFHRTQVTNLLKGQLYSYVETPRPVTPTQDKPSCSSRRDSSSDTGDETVYSCQGYETERIQDVHDLTSDEESNVASSCVDDNSCYDEEHTYRVEYEVAGGTDSENEDGTKKKRKFDSSAEDSDFADVKLGEPQLSAEKTDFADWADSDSDFSEEKSNFFFEPFPAAKKREVKCRECQEPVESFVQYCSACWKERKSWIPARPKPRRCKKDKNFRKKSSSNKTSTYAPLPPNASSSQEIPSTSSSFATCQRSVTSETVRDLCELNLSSPTESTTSGGSGSQSVDSGISSQESLFADSQEYYTPDPASQIDNDVSTSGRKRARDDDDENVRENKLSCVTQNINSEIRTAVKQDVLSEARKEDSVMPSTSSAIANISEALKQGPSTSHHSATSLLCTMCYLRPKEASFVHGNISHQVCCYPCAKTIFKRKGTCPVCRRRVEKITKNIIV